MKETVLLPLLEQVIINRIENRHFFCIENDQKQVVGLSTLQLLISLNAYFELG